MRDLGNLRNFSIIAHIDHGKSTLADRLLELTGTVEKRKMKEQVLDQMDLERERGITIKMQPVRMNYRLQSTDYVLNLIDTPGHIDFSYEVSRALKAVEGALLLVDSTQGVQAQTLSVLELARAQGLTIIPVVNKIDMPFARVDEVTIEVAKLLNCDIGEVLRVSGKTGEGVPELLSAIVERIPPPASRESGPKDVQALVFDFSYSPHRGVVVYARVLGGSIKKGDRLRFVGSGQEFTAASVGVFRPEEVETEELGAGEIGFIVTAVKQPRVAQVGDTLTRVDHPMQGLEGYMKPRPVVWASIYPENQDNFFDLKDALVRLSLSDSSIEFEEEASGTAGRGFRCGFLGMLHMEIITERLKREFNLELIITTPTISYEIERAGKQETIYSAADFPEDRSVTSVREPWIDATIITPSQYVGAISKLFHEHEIALVDTESFSGDRVALNVEMPLREMMRNFFDELKSASSGFASLSYKPIGLRDADIVRLDILVAEEVIPAFARVVARRQVESEGEDMVEKLEKILPRQLFEVKIQAKALGRIIASRRIAAMRKDVTGYLYGGDITRKKKLLEKQKKGKKKMKARGRVEIPQEVFLKMTKR